MSKKSHTLPQSKPYYWQSPEALAAAAEQKKEQFNEFAESLPLGKDKSENGHPSRRDFLKLMGFSVAAASLAACEAPLRKAIPYLNKPEEIDPGLANYYATSYQAGSTSCGLIVKTREGRPIKVEGNPQDPLSEGGVSAQIEASILGLYDKARYRGPEKQQKSTSWEALDAEVSAQLSAAARRGKPIFLMSRSFTGPSTAAAVAALKARYPTLQQVVYDSISYAAALDAHRDSFGLRALPFYDVSQASVLVSFSADFLGTYLAPTLFGRQFAKGRKISSEHKKMSRLFVFEANMSLTGANADYRSPIRADEEAAYLANLYNLLISKKGGRRLSVPKIPQEKALQQVAQALWAARGASVLLSGNNNYTEQMLCCAINELLGNYGRTLRWDKPFYFAQGDDKAFSQALQSIQKGDAGAVIFYDCNPVYEHPRGAALAEALTQVPLSLSTSYIPDETSQAVQYVAPNHHYLEAWGDAEPIHGCYHLMQPTISPLFRSRQAQESFLAWSGAKTHYFEFLKKYWRENLYPKRQAGSNFQTFFDKCLHDGIYLGPSQRNLPQRISYKGNLSGLSFALPKAGLQLVPYFSVALGPGEQAGNPWLQELPDPISKICWENCLSVAPSEAKALGIHTQENETSLVALSIGNTKLEVPAIAQPGQAPGTMGLALGYGRRVSNQVGQDVGVDLYSLLDYEAKKHLNYRINAPVSVKVIGRREVAMMQTQHTHMGRKTAIQESTLEAYLQDEGAGRYHPKIATHQGPQAPSAISLWEGHAYPNHHWGMVIDLNSCTGCNACVVACQAENNIPVVGKDEVIRRREMHWLRIDRYYSSAADPKDRSVKGLAALEKAADNPAVVFQPMLCQHCNNAPCETVCPVAATTHSSEGLNQMTYNRCVGTRYCANNCPYKVRRFNWFKYHDNDQFAVNTTMHNALGKMVLNPDVTVRSRGVMEKCSFCVQRIQAGKLQAKLQKRSLTDNDVKTACATACPSEAITFGDLKNPESRISQALRLKKDKKGTTIKEKRAYHVLEELNVSPNIWYLSKIRNKTSQTS